ncbi:MAG: DUF2203 family protein [Planctomycetota bacterium]
MQRLFTADSASRTLPLVTRIVDDIQRVYREREALGDALMSNPEAPDADERQRDFDAATRELTEFARELESVGCVLKDAAGGLVDFPGEIDGDEVWLCWQPGETEVAYWHPLDTGFSGRRPIPVGASN